LRRKAGCGAQNRRDRGEGAALQKMSSGNCQIRVSYGYAALLRPAI
jgi:hypothetical protein